jgi:ribosomal protein S4
MSFLELLKKSRQEASQLIEKRKVDIDGDGQKHPAQYFTGLDEKTKREREAEIERRQEEGVKAPELYEDLPGDEDAETEPSKYTKTEGAQKVRDEIKGPGKEEFIRAASKVSGVAADIIEEVYDKGLKAFATSGHRPGASATGWAVARVYAFLFDEKSGARKVDQHLWEKHEENQKSILKPIYNIKQEIVKALKYSLKQTKNKYHTPRLAKHAEKLLKNEKLYLSDFEFCFNRLQHQQDEKRLDFWLLGGKAMIQLQKYLKIGITLNQALEMPYQEETK